MQSDLNEVIFLFNKELSHAEKIKISEDYANEKLEKKLDLLLENIK